MDENKKIKFVQILTIIGEQYTFESPTDEGYNPNTEQFCISNGDDVTLFPREAVIAYRVVYEADQESEPTPTNHEGRKIVDIFGNNEEEDYD